MEWVNPRTLIKKNKPFSFTLKQFNLNKGDRTSRWVGHSKVKQSDTIDFFKREYMIEDMEAEFTELS